MKKHLAAAIAAMAFIQACGIYKDRDDKVLVVEQNQSEDGSDLSTDNIVASFQEVYYLYAGKDGIGRGEIGNILAKYKPIFEKRLSGQRIDVNELVDILFSIDQSPNGDSNGKIDLGELSGAIKSFPAIRWISTGEKVTRDVLRRRLINEHPYCSETALEGYLNALFLFSRDGQTLEQKDILIPTLVMSMLFENVDITNGLKLSPNADEQKRIVFQHLQLKIDQQVFGREFIVEQKSWLEHIFVDGGLLGAFFKEGKVTTLAKTFAMPGSPMTFLAAKVLNARGIRLQEDTMLEWMQLSLKYIKVHQVLSEYSSAEIPLAEEAQLKAVLQALEVKSPENYLPLAALYDSPQTIFGKRNGRLDVLEVFNMWTDILYYTSAFDSLEMVFLPGHFLKPSLEEQLYTLDHLFSIYPHAAKDIILFQKPEPLAATSQSIRPALRESLCERTPITAENRMKRSLSPVLFLKELTSVRVVNSIFMIYDTDRDEKMSLKETQKFLSLLGFEGAQATRLFFMNSDKMKRFHELSQGEIESVIRGKEVPDALRPSEFYERVKNLGL